MRAIAPVAQCGAALEVDEGGSPPERAVSPRAPRKTAAGFKSNDPPPALPREGARRPY